MQWEADFALESAPWNLLRFVMIAPLVRKTPKGMEVHITVGHPRVSGK